MTRYAAFASANTVVFYARPDWHLFVWGLLGVSSACAILLGVRRHRPDGAFGWVLLALAVLTFVSGDTSYNILQAVFPSRDLFPSIADIFYLTMYPLFSAGLLALIRRQRAGSDLGSLIDATIITAGLGMLSWVFLVSPYVRADELSTLVKAFSVAYPLGDILLLAMVARLLTSGGLRTRSVQLLAAGSVGLLVADAAYGWIQLHGTWRVGGPVDSGWAVFYTLAGMAALHPSMVELTVPQAGPTRRLRPAMLLTLTAACLIAPVTLLVDASADTSSDLVVIGVFDILLCLLVVARLAGMVREYDRGLARERVIGNVVGSLVSAVDVVSVCSQIEQASRALVRAQDARASFECVTIPASAPALLQRIDAEIGGASGVCALSPELAGELTGHASRPVTLCPLRGESRLLGAVLLVAAPNIQAALRGALDVLSGNASLALNRILIAEQYKHRAFHDGLSGLANRELYVNRIDNALERAARTGGVVGVILIDVDDFKEVNDTLGHEVGDQLLVALAERLRTVLRVGDTAARLGGDEFAVLVEGLSMSDVNITAQRVVQELSDQFPSSRGPVAATVSVGVATSLDGASSTELLRYADLALYAAKEMGKRGWHGFEQDLHTGMVARLELRTRIAQAMADDEFLVYYQPIVEVASGVVVGVEALVRWMHPENGITNPDYFITVAEETGLIVDIGRQVLHESLARVCEWNAQRGEAPALRLSVNVSPRQLYGSNFVATVDAALAEYPLDPELLTLELTEGVLLRNDSQVSSSLDMLRSRGIHLAIDDFGTGYSALGYLRDFPVTTLKIDRSFISGLPSPRAKALVEAILRMADSMGLRVVAEGIEKASHRDAVAAMGCRLGQGFLYAEPMSAEDFRRTLLSGAHR